MSTSVPPTPRTAQPAPTDEIRPRRHGVAGRLRGATPVAGGSAGTAVAGPPLLRAVVAAMRRIHDLDGAAGRAHHEGRLAIDQMLRGLLAEHEKPGPHDAAVPAVRVACAHLAAGGVEDAYLALLTARDLLSS